LFEALQLFFAFYLISPLMIYGQEGRMPVGLEPENCNDCPGGATLFVPDSRRLVV